MTPNDFAALSSAHSGLSAAYSGIAETKIYYEQLLATCASAALSAVLVLMIGIFTLRQGSMSRRERLRAIAFTIENQLMLTLGWVDLLKTIDGTIDFTRPQTTYLLDNAEVAISGAIARGIDDLDLQKLAEAAAIGMAAAKLVLMARNPPGTSANVPLIWKELSEMVEPLRTALTKTRNRAAKLK